MAVKLGAVLVREGHITPAQLEEALKIQVIYGGRLGTNLVELGSIELDKLSEVLARVMGVPVATSELFEASDAAARNIMTTEQVERLECFPLKVDGRKLHVALVDPSDIAKVDDIAFLTDTRVLPYVAPEMRLFYYLEKVYGIVRKLRYIRLAPEPRDSDERRAQPVVLGQEAEEALPEGEVIAEESPPPSAFDAGPLIQAPPPVRTKARPPAPVPAPAAAPIQPLTLAEATAALGATDHRDQIAEIILRCAHRYFEEAILFVVRDGNAIGWRAHGPRSDKVQIDALIIPLNAPSIFQGVYQTHVPFFGLVPDQPLNRRFYQHLHSPRPLFTMILPLLIRDRPVNLLYGDNGKREVPLAAFSEMAELLKLAAHAYELIILDAKRKMEI